ncbi:MAG: acyl-CoA-binding protein [Luteimonas sp.]
MANAASLRDRFEQAAKEIHRLDQRPDNDTLLRLYALYKQGAEGNAVGDKPGFFDFVGTAKYEAWSKLNGMTEDEAMQQYVVLVETLTAKRS